IYLSFNAGRSSAHGWGIAMSTDTAFALGLLALVGPRFPDRLRAFMLTVVVVDDIVALVVIATVYTDTLRVVPLLAAVGFFGAVLVLRSVRVRVGLLYFVLGAGAWVGLLKSGVEPIVVGLVMGLLVFAYPTPRVPRATHGGLGTRGRSGAQVGDLAQRTVAAAIPPLDELLGCAAVRAGERGYRARRRLPYASLQLADHARDPGRLRRRQAGRHSRFLVACDSAEPRTTAAAGGLGRGRRGWHDRRDRLHRLAAGRDTRLRRAAARGGEGGHPQRRPRSGNRDLAGLPRYGAAT